MNQWYSGTSSGLTYQRQQPAGRMKHSSRRCSLFSILRVEYDLKGGVLSQPSYLKVSRIDSDQDSVSERTR